MTDVATQPTLDELVGAPPARPSTIAPPNHPGTTAPSDRPTPPSPPAGEQPEPGTPEAGGRDYGVQILGTTGAFLLVVAAALFDLFGARWVGAVGRLAVVVALDALLVLVTRAAWRRAWLRPVAPVFLGAATLVFPLLLAAAAADWARGHGDLSLPFGATACALLYAGLGVRLRSVAYGVLASAAALTAVISGSLALLPPSKVPLGLAVATALGVLVDAAVRLRLARRATDDPVAAVGRWSIPFVLGTAALADGWAFVVSSRPCEWSAGATPACPLQGPPVSPTLLATTLALVGCALLLGALSSTRRVWAVPGAVSALGAVALSPGVGRLHGLAVALSLLAVAWAAHLVAQSMATPGENATVTFLDVVSVLAASALLLVFHAPSWPVPFVLAAGAVVPLRVAARRRPAFWALPGAGLLSAAGFFAIWTVAAAAGVVSSAAPGAATALMLEPVAVAWVAAVVWGRRRRDARRHGAAVMSVVLATAALIAAVGSASPPHWLLVGNLLLVDWALFELVVEVEEAVELAPLGLVLGSTGALAVARGLGFSAVAAPLALLPVAGFLVAVGWARRRPDGQLVLGLGTAAVAVGWSLADLVRPGPTPPAAALAAIGVTAVLLLVADRTGRWWGRWLALAVLGLASLPLARLVGASSPQPYVLGPGLALVAIGVALPGRRRGAEVVEAGRVLSVAGLALLLGTTAIQAFADGDPWHLGLLVVEGVLSVALGVAAHRRVPVVAGAAAVAASGLGALSGVSSSVRLLVVIGAVAVGLLLAAVVMLARRRGPVRTRSWSTWW